MFSTKSQTLSSYLLDKAMHRATVRSGVRSLLVSIVKQPEEIQSELLWHLVHVDLNRIPDWINRVFVQQPILSFEHHLIELPIIPLAMYSVVSN